MMRPGCRRTGSLLMLRLDPRCESRSSRWWCHRPQPTDERAAVIDKQVARQRDRQLPSTPL